MSDLASRIVELETKLEQVTKIVSQISVPTKKRTRNRRHAGSSISTPVWADEVKNLLAQVSADLQEVKKEVSRSSPRSVELVHGPSTSAGSSEIISSLQPNLLSVPHQRNNEPAQSQSPAQSFHTPGQRVQFTVPGEQREDDPCSSAGGAPNTAISTPLTSIPSDVESTPLPSPEGPEQATEEALSMNSPVQHSPSAETKFSLTIDEIGQNLPSSIATMVADDEFNGYIRVKDLVRFDLDTLAIANHQPEYREQLANEYVPDPTMKGCSRLRVSTSANFTFPEYSMTPPRPSDGEVRNYLHGLANTPPQGQIPYYVGPALTPDFNSLLHSGKDLSDFAAIEGVNSLYWHAGSKGSGTAVHNEDAELRSANLVLFGWKIWILIRDYHTARFEEFVKLRWETNRCAQFVRHLSLFISPSTLEDAGIEFTIHCAGPGEMIVTSPNQYHMVANFTNCFAVAINFLLPGEAVIPADLAVCEQCGLFPLAHEGLRAVSCPLPDDESEQSTSLEPLAISVAEKRKLRPMKQQAKLRPATVQVTKTPSDAPPPYKRRKRTSLLPSDYHELEEVVNQIKNADALCKIPSMGSQPSSPRVLKLAAAIYSRSTILQFCSLVRSKRDLDTECFRCNFSQTLTTRVEQRLNNIDLFQRRSYLGSLCARLEAFYLAQDIENSKDGRIRASPDFIKEILKQSKISKKTLEKHRTRGNKWRRLCQGYEGLLCLICLDGENPFGISPNSYLSLDDAEVSLFHGLLNSPYARSLCSAANAFQRSLDSRSYDVEFRWEAENKPLEGLPEDEMLALLQPFPLVPENIYEPDKHQDWSRPSSWPEEWPWPADPTAILVSDNNKCDFCFDQYCDCIHNGPAHKPRIKNYGQMGRGLQAVASSPGKVAFEADKVIGFMTGRILPPGTSKNNWAVDFARPDLDDEVVCQIDCADAGNCFRLLNHSCRPPAQLDQVRVGGRYVTAVKAMRDILDSEEITIYYGREWADKHCTCEVHQK